MALDKEVNNKSPRAEKEEKIFEFWKENNIFQKTLEKDSPRGEFVFYEGPPTANGRPGIHHIAARSFKDAIPRYKTMRGFHVGRRAGWDTHGLPVELEVEKALGLKSKKDIENFGVSKFNQECKKNVWKYIDEWKNLSDRMGYWVDFKNAYVTYDNSYIESVWSIVAKVKEKNLLYKDYKVVPWCPRCGTVLSSHELAQGYEDVKDLSVYVKFRVSGEENAYFLAWTTTPWTLPGNVALAVGEKIDYVKIKTGDNFFILAESRLAIINEEYEVVEKMKGKDLLGYSYEPLYPYLKNSLPDTEKEKLDKAYKIYGANFVTEEDGTGIVHTAIMYGQDDFILGTEIGLPKHHLVDETGHFKEGTDFLSGRFVKEEETSVEIIKDLAHRGLLFKKEKHEHSYPHCWRCKTPLIYYARDSWYIKMSSLRDELVKENKEINWEPDYIKEGRFGEWLKDVKDWAISRERYWGTPLPIWQTEEKDEMSTVSSIEEIRNKVKKSGNKYFVIRHGGTEGNAKDVVSYKNENKDDLTTAGKAETQSAGKNLIDKKIDLIISSPFLRTRETAEIISETIGLEKNNIFFDERLKEINPGIYDGKPWIDYHQKVSQGGEDWFTRFIEGGESLVGVQKRVGEFIYEIENTYKDRNILIVTHGGPAWLLYVASGLFEPQNKEYEIPDKNAFVKEFKRFQNAEVRELPFVPLPHDENFSVDLHKPYIDDVVLISDSGKEMRRTKEVMDVWFDSGAMPFAQDPMNVLYPADFISEAIDQTRGWFYTLHAVGVLMGRGKAFKNVICLGHLLDKDGKKMSKSLGNTINPWEMIDKHGVDLLRLWMYSVNQPGEPKNFDERTVEEIGRKVFNLLENIYTFYDLYRDKNKETNDQPTPTHPLDLWILARLHDLNIEMTDKLDNYKLLEPVRALRDFIDDFSTWYLRRSRDRIKEGDREAHQTIYFVLKNISKLTAPFAPFFAEDLYQNLKLPSDPQSVHLEAWPQVPFENKDVIEKMIVAREIVSVALDLRSKSNIKIRQPLQSLRVNLRGAFAELIKEEINVKEVIDINIEAPELDINLTPLLIEEGEVRDIIRNIQETRKEKGLKPSDTMEFNILEDKIELYEKYKETIEKATNVKLAK
ncbi:MAG: class I tRNA ligase family protein [bacterium]|nr:class I tRNA ligase family protein [bacterium]